MPFISEAPFPAQRGIKLPWETPTPFPLFACTKVEELENSWEEKEPFQLEDNGGAGTSFHF